MTIYLKERALVLYIYIKVLDTRILTNKKKNLDSISQKENYIKGKLHIIYIIYNYILYHIYYLLYM